MLASLGTPDMITVLVFTLSWQTVYFGNVTASSRLSLINLLALLYFIVADTVHRLHNILVWHGFALSVKLFLKFMLRSFDIRTIASPNVPVYCWNAAKVLLNTDLSWNHAARKKKSTTYRYETIANCDVSLLPRVRRFSDLVFLRRDCLCLIWCAAFVAGGLHGPLSMPNHAGQVQSPNEVADTGTRGARFRLLDQWFATFSPNAAKSRPTPTTTSQLTRFVLLQNEVRYTKY